MDKLDNLLNTNNGVLTLQQAKKAGISYSYIKKRLDAGEIEKEESGIYRLAESYVDEYFAISYRYPKGVFSLETALWLHGLSLTVPFEMVMSFPYGTNTKLMKQAGLKPIILRNNHEIGITKVTTPSGHLVPVYEVERTLVECLRPIYKIDVQIIAPAFKAYAQKGKINFSKLFYYAKLFKVEQKVQSYIEVLE